MLGRSHHRDGGGHESSAPGYWPRSHSRDRHVERDRTRSRTNHRHFLRRQYYEHGGDGRQTSEQRGTQTVDGSATSQRSGEAETDLGLKHVIVMVRRPLESERSGSSYGSFFPHAPQPPQQPLHSSTKSPVSSAHWRAAEHATVSTTISNVALDKVETASTSVAAIQYSSTTQLSSVTQNMRFMPSTTETLDNDPTQKSTAAAHPGSFASLQPFQEERSFAGLPNGEAPPIFTGVPPFVTVLTSSLPVVCMIVFLGVWIGKRRTRSRRGEGHPVLEVEQSHPVSQPLLSPHFAERVDIVDNNLYEVMDTPPPTQHMSGAMVQRSIVVTRNKQRALALTSASPLSAAISSTDSPGGLRVSAGSSTSGYETPLHFNGYQDMSRIVRLPPATTSDHLQSHEDKDDESLR